MRRANRDVWFYRRTCQVLHMGVSTVAWMTTHTCTTCSFYLDLRVGGVKFIQHLYLYNLLLLLQCFLSASSFPRTRPLTHPTDLSLLALSWANLNCTLTLILSFLVLQDWGASRGLLRDAAMSCQRLATWQTFLSGALVALQRCGGYCTSKTHL